MALMDPFAGATLAGQAASAFLKRSRVAVSVNEDYDIFGDIGVKAFFFPLDSPEKLSSLLDHGGETFHTKPYAWVVANGGYELGHTVFEFTIQALNAAVALIGGKPVVTRNLAVTPGIAVVPPPLGGPLEGRFLSVSLDTARIDCRDGDNPGAPSMPFRFDIPQGTTDIFRVHASTSVPCMWHLQLLFVVNGKRVEVDVRRDNSDEFITLPRNYEGITSSYEWQDRWVQVPNRLH